MRVTFFIVEVCGPKVPFSAVEANPPGSEDYNRISRFYDRSRCIRVGHRQGAWSVPALQRLAQRSGVTLNEAYTIARDCKGFIEASRREIYKRENHD